MASEDSKKYPPPPIIIIEESGSAEETEADPSSATVKDKIRKLSASSETATPKSPRMAKAEETREQLNVKLNHIKAEFLGLQRALNPSYHEEGDDYEEGEGEEDPIPPNPSDVELELKILTQQVEATVKLRQTLICQLLKEKKTPEANIEEAEALKLSRSFMRLELAAEEFLNSARTSTSTPSGHEDDIRTANKFFHMKEAALDDVATQLSRLRSFVETEQTARLPPAMDETNIYWEEFVKINDTYMSLMGKVGSIQDIHIQNQKKLHALKQKTELERKAKTMIKASEPDSPHHSSHHHEFKYRQHLPKLASDPKEWLPFWAHFQEIHDDPNMKDVRKMQALIQATAEGSEARETVNFLAVAGKNYSTAIERLRDLYGRPNVLIKVYMMELLQMAVNKSLGKSIEFRKLEAKLSALVSNLESLGMVADKCEKAIYPIVESCIPSNVLANYQRTLNRNSPDDLKKLLKFLQEEVVHANERQHAQFKLEKKKPATSGNGKKKESATASSSSAATFHNSEKKLKCIFCDDAHHSKACRTAYKMVLEDREQLIKNKGACFVCLEVGHRSNECPNRDRVKCSVCGKPHYKVTCRQTKSKSNGEGEDNNDSQTRQHNSSGGSGGQQGSSQPPPQNVAGLKSSIQSPNVPLQLLTLVARGVDGKSRLVRALLDTGSQQSYIAEALHKELKFEKIKEENLSHNLFGGSTIAPRLHDMVKLFVSGADGNQPCTFDVFCIPRISDNIASSPGGPWIEEFARRGVTFQPSSTSTTIDILIGNDVTPRLYTGRIVDLGTGPVAMETKWGWVLCGKLPQQPQQPKKTTMVNITTTLLDLPLSALWDLDSLGIQDSAAKENKDDLAMQTQKHFEETVKINSEGRYEVSLPFLAGAKELLPTNYFAAERRLKITTEKIRQQGYIKQYGDLFMQWETDGMIEDVTEGDNRENGHYLPHRAVVKLTSSTTPIRPVFDASAKQKGKPSLNSCLEKGPNYLELIPSLITRFRLEKVGVTADIKKAFQQISVIPEDRQYLKFLWWKDEKRSNIKVYRHARVVFGVSSSPFLLAATLQHHLDKAPPALEKTAKIVKTSDYVDNLVTSVPSMEEAKQLEFEAQQLLLPAKFDLRGWEFGPVDGGKIVPVLGLNWDTQHDIISYDLTAAEEKMGAGSTQRIVLSLAHMLFDPVGILSPFIILAKLVLKKCHQQKLGWDKPLPAELEEDFAKWSKQIPILKRINFARHVFYAGKNKQSLHVFGDASGEAFAAVVYLRAETPAGVVVSLLQAKSKVAPKNATIPRLELLGCLIGVRLAKTVLEDLNSTTIPTTYWSDSTTAITWITGDGPWSIFVNNRVDEIRKNTETSQWRHVPGKQNPADLPSRGCSATKLLESEWWKGPTWLYEPKELWPKTMGEVNKEDVEKERKKTVVINTVTATSPVMDKFLKLSSYPRILHAVAKWNRVRENLLHRVERRRNSITTKLTVPVQPTEVELRAAEVLIIRHAQRKFTEEPSRIQKLRPFLDQDGLWRTKTRLLQEEEIDINPIILPDDNEFARRMVRSIHEQNYHIGTQLLLSKVRERFWLLNGRRTCRKIVKSCWICRRYNSKRLEVDQPPLPITRTGAGVPFNVVGVDMAGPLILRNKKKVWIALFTCASYRAIHLEVVDSMSTEEFLLAFRRFVARRGKPSTVYSDNGLNFTGARAVLKKVYGDKVKIFARDQRIDWRFSVPAAPWWGGFYERLIGLTKSLLRKQLGKRSIDRKELEVLVLEAEEALNNRPLTYISEDPDDPMPLTPNMIVRNSGLSFLPELDMRDGQSARATLRRVQRMKEALRSKFRKEYLGQLKFERKKRMTMTTLKPGDVVLIERDNERRQFWPLAVVTEVILGRDGVARKFRLKTKGGVLERPAQRLFPMELVEDIAQQQG